MAEVASLEAQPDATSRVGCKHADKRNLIGAEFFLDVQVANTKKLTHSARHADPNIPLGVFRDRDRGPQRASIPAVDFPKLAILVNGQQVVHSNPQPPGMVLPERSNPLPR